MNLDFILTSTSDFDGLENAANYQIIQPCKFIQWPWHSDAEGCFILLDKVTNEYWHVYHNQVQVVDRIGHTIPQMFSANDHTYDYSTQCYFYRVSSTKNSTLKKNSLITNTNVNNKMGEDMENSDSSLAPSSNMVAAKVSKAHKMVPVQPMYTINDVGKSVYKTENSPLLQQNTRFSVNLGLDLGNTYSIFDTHKFGIDVHSNLYKLLRLYIDTILPSLNNGLTLEQVVNDSNVAGGNTDNIVINHLLPEQLFDVVSVYSHFCFLRPCSIIRDWSDFLGGLRNQIMGVIRLLAQTNDGTLKAMMEKKEKLREKKVCSAHTFATGRNIIPEFRCSAKNSRECPHIIAQINADRICVLDEKATLCHFLLAEYLATYDESVVNATFGFKCHFVNPLPRHVPSLDFNPTGREDPLTTSYNRNVDYTHNNIDVFNLLMGRHVNVHRMCLPQRFLTLDWFLWLLKLINITSFNTDTHF